MKFFIKMDHLLKEKLNLEGDKINLEMPVNALTAQLGGISKSLNDSRQFRLEKGNFLSLIFANPICLDDCIARFHIVGTANRREVHFYHFGSRSHTTEHRRTKEKATRSTQCHERFPERIEIQQS